MNFPLSFLAIGSIAVILLLHSCAVYWQERKVGSSHEASLRESAVVTLLFLGATAVDYLAVVSKYA